MFQKPPNQITLALARFLTTEEATTRRKIAGFIDFYCLLITTIIAILLLNLSHFLSIIDINHIQRILEMCRKL